MRESDNDDTERNIINTSQNQSAIGSISIENPPVLTEKATNEPSIENINDSNSINNSNNNPNNHLLYESQQSQIFFINESKGEKDYKNPLSIFESKDDEIENEISLNEIEEEEESNSDNEKEIDKELYYKKIRPKVQKKISRIVKAKAVSFTLDKKKKVDKYYA